MSKSNQSPTDVVGLWPTDQLAWFSEEVPIVQLIPSKKLMMDLLSLPTKIHGRGVSSVFPALLDVEVNHEEVPDDGNNPGLHEEEVAQDFPKMSRKDAVYRVTLYYYCNVSNFFFV